MVTYPSSDKQAYLKSKNATKLVVPAPLQGDEISSFYFLPDANGNKKVSIKPWDMHAEIGKTKITN